ncbi:4Fe-4S dicluster domain-containing protein [candidate division CSSED10-310 bacterium]|uniref:4Fe-4S dicluster domain-containing protein n=1 Tax=candidate division CSSED10-310 bacterium TaxID=2855610 RepID=A0ABV6Z3L6_UNCC1
MKKKLIVDNTVCCGCLSCMTNCSQYHDSHASPESARIKVNLEPFSGVHTIIYCQQCDEAECHQNCPQGAISLSETGNYYEVDYQLCVDCHTCIEVCPYGAMFYNPFRERVMKCDLCHGDPICAQSCFSGALWYGAGDEEQPDKLVSRYFFLEKKKKKANAHD